MSIVTINEHNRNMVADLATRNWGSAVMVTKGKIHDIKELPGFLYMEGADIKGMISYEICDNECEIVLLESFEENHGIASTLLMLTIETATAKCRFSGSSGGSRTAGVNGSYAAGGI